MVLRHRVAEDRDLAGEAGDLERRRLEEAQALGAAGQAGELLQQRRNRDREAEGREREIEPGEPQGRDADDEPDDPGRDSGERDGPDVAPVLVHDQRRGRVAADCHQRAVSERDLAGVAREQVQADDRDEEDARTREVARVEVADEVRKDEEDAEPCGHREQPGADPERAAHQTLLAEARPNSPAGRTSSTPRITASATGSRRSVPIQSTYVPIRFTKTPSSRAPTTAPNGLEIPPRTAPAKA